MTTIVKDPDVDDPLDHLLVGERAWIAVRKEGHYDIVLFMRRSPDGLIVKAWDADLEIDNEQSIELEFIPIPE